MDEDLATGAGCSLIRPVGHLLPSENGRRLFAISAFSRVFSWEKVPKGDEGPRDGFLSLFRPTHMSQPIPRILANARSLRRAETAAEIRLWEQLRGQASQRIQICPPTSTRRCLAILTSCHAH